ncbi:MAG: tRNA dihydrouridine synthase DusB [Clostridia bacterium]|nr:tRNA dihydrouridine synthase DusB [Clostridia bacterium]
MNIGNVKIEGLAALAPMAGVTDKAYRKICRDFGAAFTVTEMVSSRAILFNYKKTNELFDIKGEEPPTAIQLFGDDPAIMAEAAKAVMVENPAFIDVNMGCPVPKIAGNNCGSALMKTPEKCGEIVYAMSKAVDVPITVKIRKGWDKDHVNAVEVAKICEEAGAKAITVHGRTKEQMYRPYADLSIIKEVKENVNIPVIGNGDVTDANSAAKMIAETGCDMVMVGRGALGRPWVFQEINAALRDEVRIMPEPPLSKRLLVMRKHIEDMCRLKGENRAMREARKHVAWYIHGLRGAAEFRRMSSELETLSDLDMLIKAIFEENMKED